MKQAITFHPIGIIHSPFHDPAGMPVQPNGAQDVQGTIDLDPELAAGLQDLNGFSHIILLYHFDRTSDYILTARPFLDDVEHGIFAIRAPRRPNPIGLSVVRLIDISGHTLTIQGVDMLDGTPLLDIKPFVPYIDAPLAERSGWFEGKDVQAGKMRSDDRFA